MPGSCGTKCARESSPWTADDPALQEFTAAAVKRYDYVNKIARSFGADFLLFWQPCWWVETAPVDPAVQVKEKATIIIGDRWALKQNFVTIYQCLWRRVYVINRISLIIATS